MSESLNKYDAIHSVFSFVQVTGEECTPLDIPREQIILLIIDILDCSLFMI